MVEIKIDISFTVDETNTAGVAKFHDSLAAYLDQLKQDFGEVKDFLANVNTSEIEEINAHDRSR